MGWIKVNVDTAARGSPHLATCFGIYKGSIGEYFGGIFLGLFWD